MSSKNELLLLIMADMIAGAEAPAADAVAIWQAIARKFAPLLGPASTRLLLERSLGAIRSSYPWLPPATLEGVAEPPFLALKTSLDGRERGEAVAATRALLDSYIELVTKLIGPRLAEQFLRSAFHGDADNRNTEENAG